MAIAHAEGMNALCVLMVAVALLAFLEFDRGICLSCPGLHRHRSGSTERSPSASLKTLASAQADFRANDRDGDGVRQFWRGDVAGLYALVHKEQGALKLIELSVAGADDRPLTEITRYTVRSPKAGYLFRALRHADEDPKKPSPDRFAAVAFPAHYNLTDRDRFSFILDENNAILRADLGHGRGIDVYPTPEELRKTWSKLD